MKNYVLLAAALFLISCQSAENKPEQATEQSGQPEQPKQQVAVNYETATFDELFKEIDPKEMDANVFKLLNEDWSVVTAGKENDYNSMIASWGGYGILFEKPVSWLFLNGSRFTLEKIKANDTFTLSYMDSTYKEQKMVFGTKSGRDTDKMKETKLHSVVTPEGNIAYKESYLIVELKLESLIEVKPETFKTEEHRKFVEEGREKGNGKDYHNLVTGIITRIWVRK